MERKKGMKKKRKEMSRGKSLRYECKYRKRQIERKRKPEEQKKRK